MGRDLGGNKFDQGKAPLGMLPRVALEQEAQVMEFGAKKYGKFNYKKGMKWSRLIDAALRHVYTFADGEDADKETGISHLAHARCCMGFLLEYIDKNIGEDDRHHEEKPIAVDTTTGEHYYYKPGGVIPCDNPKAIKFVFHREDGTGYADQTEVPIYRKQSTSESPYLDNSLDYEDPTGYIGN